MTTALHLAEAAHAPTEEDSRLAREASQRLASCPEEDGIRLTVVESGVGGEVFALPPIALRLLRTALQEFAEGNTVAIIPQAAELTTQEAANVLGVSRPYLVRLLEAGEIPFRKVGTHRRVRLRDIVEYRRRVDALREQALDELAAQAQELGMGY